MLVCMFFKRDCNRDCASYVGDAYPEQPCELIFALKSLSWEFKRYNDTISHTPKP